MLRQDLKSHGTPAMEMVVNRSFEGKPDLILMATLTRAAKSLDANERAILEELAIGYNSGKLEAAFDLWSGEIKWSAAQKN